MACLGGARWSLSGGVVSARSVALAFRPGRQFARPFVSCFASRIRRSLVGLSGRCERVRGGEELGGGVENLEHLGGGEVDAGRALADRDALARSAVVTDPRDAIPDGDAD